MEKLTGNKHHTKKDKKKKDTEIKRKTLKELEKATKEKKGPNANVI
jgi:hypothetical protein